MKQDYFVYHDKIYNFGTMLKVRQLDFINNNPYEVDAMFICYHPNTRHYVIKINNCICHYTEDMFYKILVDVSDKSDVSYVKHPLYENSKHNKKTTLWDELNVDGMLVAWIWYIFIMVVATIFVARLGIWIIASIIFFAYRDKKLRKAGLKK